MSFTTTMGRPALDRASEPSAFQRIFTSRWYLTVVFATYIFAPELRRLVDFRTAYHPISVIIFLPTVVLIPAIFLVRTELRRMGAPFARVAALWIIAFTYATFVGALEVSLFSAVYALTQAAAPILIAVLLSAANRDESITSLYDHVANVLLWCCFIASIYGIYQYAAPPPWDVFWAQNAAIEDSQGQTVAFGFRIFGPLNSTGPFSLCLAFSVLMNLPRIKPSKWWMLLLIAPQLIALMLTLVRSSWVLLLIGVAIYLVLSPSRGTAITSIASLVLGSVVLSAALIGATAGAADTSTSFLTRIQTFSNLSEDASVGTRLDITQTLFRIAAEEPLGHGLGSVGLSAKLGSGGETIVVDNGYIARFIEMGFVGTLLFVAAIGTGVVFGLRTYLTSLRHSPVEVSNRLAACLCIQVMFLVGQAGADVYFGSQGMFFWIAIYFASFTNLQRERGAVGIRPYYQVA